MNTDKITQIINIRFNADGHKNGDATKIAPEFDFMIPKPEPGEHQQNYISRCMKAIGNENKPQSQLLAICYAQLKG